MKQLDKLVEALCDILECDFEIEAEERVVFYFRQKGRAKKRERVFSLELNDIEKSIDLYEACTQSNDGFLIKGEGCYEKRVYFESSGMRRIPSLLLRDRKLSCKSNDGKTSIAILDHPSPEYLIFLLLDAPTEEKERLSYAFPPAFIIEDKSVDSLEGLVEQVRFFVVSITGLNAAFGDDGANLDPVRDFIENFFINVAITQGVVFTLNSNREPVRTSKRRHGELFPTCKYNKEIRAYYFQGIASAGIPFAQYIAFYHVIEYFFNNEFFNNVRDIVREVIKNPNRDDWQIEYAIKRLDSLYGDVRNHGLEREDLNLCLVSYVDLKSLEHRIQALNKDALKHYKESSVPFVESGKGGRALKINFDLLQGKAKNKTREQCEQDVYNAIRDRVYETRCAIVHSKEDGKSNYTPLDDDVALLKEMPLIRALAEEVILATAELY